MHAAAGKPLIIRDGLDLAITASLYAHSTNEGAGAFTLTQVDSSELPQESLHGQAGASLRCSKHAESHSGPSDVASGWIRWQQQCGVC
jgi:hypothetical protein